MFTQRPSLRFVAIGAVVSLFVLAFLVLGNSPHGLSPKFKIKTQERISPQICTAPPDSSAEWEFLVQRDGNNHGLSEDQCRIAFPKLFTEIDKSSELRSDKRISYQELDSRIVDDGMVRAIIDKGEVSEVFTRKLGKANIEPSALYSRLCADAIHRIPRARNTQFSPSCPYSLSGSAPLAKCGVYFHNGGFRGRYRRLKPHLGLFKARFRFIGVVDARLWILGLARGADRPIPSSPTPYRSH